MLSGSAGTVYVCVWGGEGTRVLERSVCPSKAHQGAMAGIDLIACPPPPIAPPFPLTLPLNTAWR